ncbi:C40 family peptidase [Bhargavaea cecembensis]|nr:LysM peptidoglycan-binding domain-containing protein [Bhargavaea cecembensis]
MKKVAFSVLTTSALVAILAAPGEAEASSDSYAVQSGDSLWKIATQHQVTVTQLKSWNQLTTDVIYPGQKLLIELPETGQSQNKPAPVSSSSASVRAGNGIYTVKSGDSLSKIAAIHKTTVSRLKEQNGLTGDLIFVGQKLKLAGSATVTAKPQTSAKPAQQPASQQSAPSGSYIVKSGDTLGAISIKYGISVDQLMKWNGLTSHLIHVGQKLTVNGSAVKTTGKVVQASAPNTEAAAKPTEPVKASGSVIDVAKSVIGTPYKWAGTTPSGFDCSGFIWYAFKTAGEDVARTNTDGYFNRSYYVDNPQPGDLVFFKNTYKKGISHVGIYLGNGNFIHASSSQGVVISSVNDSYWKPKFDSFKRFY